MNSSNNPIVYPTTYQTWKEIISQPSKAASPRHASQDDYYTTLLLNLFEQEYREFLSQIMVDDKFNQIFRTKMAALRVNYGYEWDTAKETGSESEAYKSFILELKANNYLNFEITKASMLICQDSRSSDNGFLSQLRSWPDILGIIGTYLNSNLGAPEAKEKFTREIKKYDGFYLSFNMKPFLFMTRNIFQSEPLGTYVLPLTTSASFDIWVSGLALEKTVSLENGYESFKRVDNNNNFKISINKGLNTVGIQILKDNTGIIAYNNITADKQHKEHDKRNNELKNTLSSLSVILTKLTKKEIDEHSKKIINQTAEYKNRIEKEKKSIWPNENKIKMWQDKAAVLETANELLFYKASPKQLVQKQELHPEWKAGGSQSATKSLVDKVKIMKRF